MESIVTTPPYAILLQKAVILVQHCFLGRWEQIKLWELGQTVQLLPWVHVLSDPVPEGNPGPVDRISKIDNFAFSEVYRRS